jgi:hypothetical protein
MGFIQIIEYQTDRPDEIQALLDEWDQASPNRLPGAKGTYCADRDNPGTYISIVEFPSYEVAMENSNRPETTTFAERMQKLCNGPATFRNLDVLDVRTFD